MSEIDDVFTKPQYEINHYSSVTQTVHFGPIFGCTLCYKNEDRAIQKAACIHMETDPCPQCAKLADSAKTFNTDTQKMAGNLIKSIEQREKAGLHVVNPPDDAEIPQLGGKKLDDGKAPLALLPGASLVEIAKVLEYGSRKYSSWNWKGGFKWSRLASASLRHLFAWIGGEDKDPETGISHLAHAACNLLFLIDFEVNGLGEDDRYKGTK